MGLRVHNPVMAPRWWRHFNVVWVVVVQIPIPLRMFSSREFNNTVFISIDTEFVVSLTRSYQLPTQVFTHSRKAAESTPSCAWTFLLSRSISSWTLLNLFFGVPAMLLVTAMIESRVCNPVVDPKLWHYFNMINLLVSSKIWASSIWAM